MACHRAAGDAAAGAGLQPGPGSGSLQLEAQVAQALQALAAAKYCAVEAEDYERAKQCKEQAAQLEQLVLSERKLEAQKVDAVRSEDYDQAKGLKMELERLRMRIQKASEAATHISQAPFVPATGVQEAEADAAGFRGAEATTSASAKPPYHVIIDKDADEDVRGADPGLAERHVEAPEQLLVQPQRSEASSATQDVQGADSGLAEWLVEAPEQRLVQPQRSEANCSSYYTANLVSSPQGSFYPSRGDRAAAALAVAESAQSEEVLRAAISQAQAAGLSVVKLRSARRALEQLEARKQQEQEQQQQPKSSSKQLDRRWNFQSRPGPLNDRFREHEAELEERRLQAFAARGRFRAEEEGEERVGGYVDRARRERFCSNPVPDGSYTFGPSGHEPNRAFSFDPPSAGELAPPRRLWLDGAFAWSSSWWGVRVEEDGGYLAEGDTIVELAGRSLVGLEPGSCEKAVHEGLPGEALVEPRCETWGLLPHTDVDEEALVADLEALAGDYAVGLELRHGPPPAILLSGTQSAMSTARAAVEELMACYYQ